MNELAHLPHYNIWVRYYNKGEIMKRCPVWVIQDTPNGYNCKSILNANFYSLNKAIETFIKIKNEPL